MNIMDYSFGAYSSDTAPTMREEIVVASIDDFFVSNEIPTNTVRSDSNVRNIKFYRMSGCRLILSLKHPSTLYFRGILGVKCLAGSVEIDGFILNKDYTKSFVVSSLATHSASSFNTTPSSIILTADLLKELAELNVCKDLKDNLLDNSCLLLLWRPESPDLSRLNSQLRNNLIPRWTSYSGSAIFSDFEEFTNNVFDIPSGYRIPKKLSFNPKVKDFGQTLLSYSVPRVLVCGGKGVGKSTSIRYITNQLLSKWAQVLFVDFDIGQPEFTVPGCVSVHLISEPLFGPSFTHMHLPSKSIFLGFVAADMCFNSYRAAVELLRNYCSEIPDSDSLPCVINTMGYVKGCGLLLINDIISTFDLSHVLELRSTNELNINFARPPIASEVMASINNCPLLKYELETLELPTLSQKSSNNPRISRELMTLFYFIGYGVDLYNNLRTQSIAILNEGSSQGRPFVSLIRNNDTLQRGEIVAVCSSNLKEDIVVYEPLGFGKVVSYSNSMLLLLTPLPEDAFVDCTIVRGDLSIRNDFFNDHLPDGVNETSNKKQKIILTSGTKTLCPSLFSI